MHTKSHLCCWRFQWLFVLLGIILTTREGGIFSRWQPEWTSMSSMLATYSPFVVWDMKKRSRIYLSLLRLFSLGSSTGILPRIIELAILFRVKSSAVELTEAHLLSSVQKWKLNHLDRDIFRVSMTSMVLENSSGAKYLSLASRMQILPLTRISLRSAIDRNRVRCWKDLYDDTNNDPWGMEYKLVSQKLEAIYHLRP